MANGQTPADQYDMIAMRLSDICAQALSPQLAALCECIRDFAATVSQPCFSMPFVFTGSITQTINTVQAVNIFQVPVGQVATITRIAVMERYPGTFYGGSFTLLVNNNFDPRFPLIDHQIGSLSEGLQVRICLEEQDTLTALIECLWAPVAGDTVTESTIKLMWPYEISGFFEPKKVMA